MNPTVVLLILDGWGHRDATSHNAIHHANTPNWDRLWAKSPRSLLNCSGRAVGLPSGQMGNSEVGHMTIGSGRVVLQDLTRIDTSIAEGQFSQIQTIQDLLSHQGKGRLHLMGLFSPGGVHSHSSHISEMIELADLSNRRVVIHAFLDGRDTPPRSAINHLQELAALLKDRPNVSVGSIHGRYFAMDRDQRWDRTLATYRLLTEGTANYTADSLLDAIEQAYARNESDEFVSPTRIDGFTPVSAGDDVFMMNFRADRARQLTHLFLRDVDEDFSPSLTHPHIRQFVCMTRYEEDIDAASKFADNVKIAFDIQDLKDTLSETLSKTGKSQLRIAETEKYAHVTYFFSGGREEMWEGESRELVPSPKVATYDLKPEMSAKQVSKVVVENIQRSEHDVIICNLANADMVGHTGQFAPAIQAVQCLDECIGDIEAAIRSTNSHLFITSDHGNVEQMQDPSSKEPHTAHTTGQVPLLYIGSDPQPLKPVGGLQDVAPTILDLMRITKPDRMTGTSLFV